MSRVESNPVGLRELARSGEVRQDLERRAQAVAARVRSAGIMVNGVPGKDPLPVDVTSSVGKNRARAQVVIRHPAGLAVEAKHRILGSSLDAAR
jgi:hypothetical protein